MSGPSLYLDYQASTPVDPAVSAAMTRCLGMTGNPHSSEHAFGWSAHTAVEEARGKVADLIGADPADVVFTSGATESNNLAFFGVCGNKPRTRDLILVSAVEHASVLGPASRLAELGFRVVLLPVDGAGRLSPETLREALDDHVLLVSVGAVNGEVGSIQDLGQIATLCHNSGALLHSDAAQALAATRLNLSDTPVDLLSVSAHKAYGPQGIGALVVAPHVRRALMPLFFGGNQQDGLRPGTTPVALAVGFGHSCDILKRVGDDERRRMSELRDRLYASLCNRIPDLALNGDRTARHPGNLNVQLPGTDARDVIQRLQPTLACSTGSACHSGSEEPSHVLVAMGLTRSQAQGSLRLGVGRFTSHDDVDRAATMIAEAFEASRRLAA